MMAGLLGMWTYYTALKMEATSKIVPIAACYPLVTALLSILILQKRSDPSQGHWDGADRLRNLVGQIEVRP